ncbi:pyruvate formate lyase family protein [Desulfoluna limicola]|nr:pyruvate formate lyase family protein [Desulfoluna limicola]
MASQFNLRPSLRKYLKSTDGWTNFTIGFKTETGTVEQAVCFDKGRVNVLKEIPGNADATMRFINDDVLKETATLTPNEMVNVILKNKVILDGNMAYLGAFNFFVSLLMGKRHQKMLDKAHQLDIKSRKEEYGINNPAFAKEHAKRKNIRLKADKRDPGVSFLNDPYLSGYSIDSFPRIKALHEKHLATTPEISPERPVLLTKWYRTNGFEKDAGGNPWCPELRQAHAFKYLMENKKPIVRPDSLVAGTTCPEEVGVLIYPDTTGTVIWGELGSIDKRVLTPYTISKRAVEDLHDIFPYWAKRTTRSWIHDHHDYPFCQKIDERFVASFNFKLVSISHTVPGLPRFVNDGTHSMIDEIRKEIKALGEGETDKLNTLNSMILCLEGLNAYAANLAEEAGRLAANERDPKRKAELSELSRICRHVPANPSRSLDEAVNAAWISWVGLLMENTNVSLSPGRLDQLFQPFFEKEMASCSTDQEKTDTIEHVIELIASYFLRNAEHHALVPDVSNYLFGGSQSETAITVGGVTPDGKDAVNDMTYIFLKVTEMLSLNDPNMNARFKLGVNSDTYLKRLCEVNFITVATPSMHNDDAVIEAFSQNSDSMEDLRDWASTGCVEITLSGKHMSHTGATSVNMVAGLEMALNNGYHPLMNWHLGPKTGRVEQGDFRTFDEFFDAFAAQQKFIIGHTTQLNNMSAEAYAYLRPTPLLSTTIEGAVQNAKDVTKGGAIYNTSGSFNIGLSDVVDSLMVIKKLVFDEKKITFNELKKAVDSNFQNDPVIHAMVRNRVPRFGSGSDEAVEMANRVTSLIHACYKSTKNYRGGDYTVGFWSVAQHVAYGTLSGALPSGRLAGQAFSPGATPHPSASPNFLDNMRDVARLTPHHMDNNIAFNVKLVPSAKDSREKTVNTMYSYVKSYFEQGGMQIQFNMVDSNVLKDAMANPEHYKNLLVRISGYNAYFVNLNKEMQRELIERAEFGM